MLSLVFIIIHLLQQIKHFKLKSHTKGEGILFSLDSQPSFTLKWILTQVAIRRIVFCKNEAVFFHLKKNENGICLCYIAMK